MIYINKTITEHLLKAVLTAAQRIGADQFVLWFYPETKARTKARLQSRLHTFIRGQNPVEAVTLYEGRVNEDYPVNFLLTGDSIDKTVLLLSKLNRFCDSISTYKTGRPEFVCAIIFHEQITLFKDDPKVETILREQDICFTKTPPSWF